MRTVKVHTDPYDEAYNHYFRSAKRRGYIPTYPCHSPDIVHIGDDDFVQLYNKHGTLAVYQVLGDDINDRLLPLKSEDWPAEFSASR